MTIEEKKASEYVFKEHLSPLNAILHRCDLKAEMQYHEDLETAFLKGAEYKENALMRQMVSWIRKNHVGFPNPDFSTDMVIENFKNYIEQTKKKPKERKVKKGNVEECF